MTGLAAREGSPAGPAEGSAAGGGHCAQRLPEASRAGTDGGPARPLLPPVTSGKQNRVPPLSEGKENRSEQSRHPATCIHPPQPAVCVICVKVVTGRALPFIHSSSIRGRSATMLSKTMKSGEKMSTAGIEHLILCLVCAR